MLFIIISITVLTAVIGNVLVRDKLSKNIINIYIFWWLLWLTLSTFNLYDLNEVSDGIYLLVLLNIIMFTLGFSIYGLFKRNKINTKVIDYEIIRHPVLNRIIVIVTIILFYYWTKFEKIKFYSDNARLERFQVGGVFSTAKELLFFNYFIEPFTIIIIIMIAYMIIYEEIRNKVFMMLIAALFFYSSIGSGRGPIIDVLIAMVLIFIIRKNNFKVEENVNRKVRLGTIVFITIVILIMFIYSSWLTASRLGIKEFNVNSILVGSNEFFKQGVIYYTGPFRALEYGIQNYSDQLGYLFGRGTFAGIDEIINTALSFLDINYDSANSIIARMLQDNIINIGGGQEFNNAYTSIIIHYFDFRVSGVIIFSFIYGIFIRKAIFLYNNMPVLPTMIIMIFLFITMINSVFKWGLQSPSSNILLIVCYLWYKFKYRKKIKII